MFNYKMLSFYIELRVLGKNNNTLIIIKYNDNN